jgi:ABC-type Zn2+ transport system substrate-binding protein/surface adhesin
MFASTTTVAQHNLMLKTYSLVGADYLDNVAETIRTMTQAQTVIIQQVITLDECHSMTERLEARGIKLNLACLDNNSPVNDEGDYHNNKVDEDEDEDEDDNDNDNDNYNDESGLTLWYQLLGQKGHRRHRTRKYIATTTKEEQQQHNNQLLLTRACSSSLSSVEM